VDDWAPSTPPVRPGVEQTITTAKSAAQRMPILFIVESPRR
jgi:hypothetical protein